MLYQLVGIIKEPTNTFGRPPVPLRDLVFCTGLKLYSNYSGRKAMSDYKIAKDAKWIFHSPHFNTIKDLTLLVLTSTYLV